MLGRKPACGRLDGLATLSTARHRHFVRSPLPRTAGSRPESVNSGIGLTKRAALRIKSDDHKHAWLFVYRPCPPVFSETIP